MSDRAGRPLIIAHRGASGHALENSLAAFREAARLGADGVELDIHSTADGRLAVFHDRVIPGLGPIERLSSSAVRSARLANGEPIPWLEDVLEAIPTLAVWIEIKGLDPAWDAGLLSLIDAADERCAVHSFDHRLIERLGRLRPSLSRGILSTSYPIDPIAPLIATGADTLWQEWPLVDPPLVAQVHSAGRRIFVWTVNDTGVARDLAALGIDGLCGNFPERLLAA